VTMAGGPCSQHAPVLTARQPRPDAYSELLGGRRGGVISRQPCDRAIDRFGVRRNRRRHRGAPAIQCQLPLGSEMLLDEERCTDGRSPCGIRVGSCWACRDRASGRNAGASIKGDSMGDRFAVAVAAGTLRSSDTSALQFAHQWTSEGVTIEAAFTGAHLLHLAAAGCVLNDIYREATTLGVELNGVRVHAAGEFDTNTWASTGITYSVQVRSPASSEELAHLLDVVDEVAEIPRAIRAGAPVRRLT